MRFEGDKDDLVVREGANVTLKCKVIAEDPRVKFEWYRYGADDTHEVIGSNLVMTNSYLEHRTISSFTISNDYVLSDDGRDATYTMKIAGNYTLNKCLINDFDEYFVNT